MVSVVVELQLLHLDRYSMVACVVHSMHSDAFDAVLVPSVVVERWSYLDLAVAAIDPVALAVIDVEHFVGHGIRPLLIVPNGIADAQ